MSAETKKRTKKTKPENSFIRLSDIELYSVNGQQLPHEPAKELSLFRQNNLDLIEVNNTTMKIKLSERLFFKPEGPFKLDIEVIGTYESSETIDEEKISDSIESLAQPLLSYAGLIIAFITEKLATLPVIVPPRKTKD